LSEKDELLYLCIRFGCHMIVGFQLVFNLIYTGLRKKGEGGLY
jgi:hypothetical protein